MPHHADPCLDHVLFSGADSPRERTGRPAPRRLEPPRAISPRTPPTAHRRGEIAPLDPLAAWLLRQAGVDASAYRTDSLSRRIPACLRHLRVNCPASARALLQRRPDLIPAALNSVLIGVTGFFRDERVFQCLKDIVLPDLLHRRQIVRIYSAGVSSGEELYSVGILLAEMGALDRAELLGLDCRPDAIAQARRGEFRSEDLERIDSRLREKYFQRHGSTWVAVPALRSRMEWQQGDLFAFVEAAPRDLILFRNVAIYLGAEHAATAWAQLGRHLAPGGFVVTGRAEQPPAWLHLQRIAPSAYRHP